MRALAHPFQVAILPTLLAFALVAGCAAPAARPPVADDFAFGAPSTPTDAPDGFGSEPSLLVTQDGSVYFTSVLGSVTARGDGVWKSTDGARTWRYLGKADYPFGGGDSDLDEMADGRLILTGQWRPAAPPNLPGVGSPYITGGESVSYSDDGGNTWTQRPTAGYLPAADRNWVATDGHDVAYLVFNDAATGLMVGKSPDAGDTWLPPVVVEGTGETGGMLGGPTGIASDAVVDAQGTLYIPYGPGPGGGTVQRVVRSSDGGETFTVHTAHRTPADASSGAIFSSLALDSAGNLFLAFAQTRDGGMGIFLTHSSDGAASWSEPVPVVPPGRSAVFPWVVAGAPGKVAVAYYATDGTLLSDAAPPETQWWPEVAYNLDALGERSGFVQVQAAPIHHKGPICTGGTSCAAGRTLGDFFESALLPDGRVALVYVDDAGEERFNRVVTQTKGPGLH